MRKPMEDFDKTQSVSSGQTAHPQDTEGNTQPVVKDSILYSMRALAKYILFLRVNQLILKTQREINNPLIWDCLPLTLMKLDTNSMILTTIADIQALLRDSKDELKGESDDEMLEAGEEFDVEFLQSANEETHHAPSTETPTDKPISIEHQSPSPNKDQPKSSKDKKTDASDSKSSSCFETFKPFENYMTIIKRQILDNLQEVQNAVKDDLALNKKVFKAVEAYTKNSSNLTELLTQAKNFDFPTLKTTVESLLAVVTVQNDHLTKWVESSSSMD
ncbi:hypothetical protein Tco_0821930 [Tanacetum coccineum]|uniref:Uncharacterized protein n=1 Tax=Tanacetum coccineum TaxID=301880 RepID=A0ABQ5AEP3_9ASTR